MAKWSHDVSDIDRMKNLAFSIGILVDFSGEPAPEQMCAIIFALTKVFDLALKEAANAEDRALLRLDLSQMLEMLTEYTETGEVTPPASH